MKQRIEWIDWAKAFAIFLMVVLHVHCNPILDSYISGFRMPFFFMISGFLFSYINNPVGSNFTNKRFRQLVVPYLWINLIAYIAWLFVLRNYGNNAADSLEWHTPLIGIFTGVGPLLIHDIPTWSLLSFFVVEVVFYFMVKWGIKWWIITIGSLLIYVSLIHLIPEHIGKLPFVIGPSIAGLMFYSFGYGIRRSFLTKYLIPQEGFRLDRNYLFIFLIALVIYIPTVYFNETIYFYTCEVGFIPYFLLSSLSGSCLVIILFLFISSFLKTPSVIKMMSIGTLLICGFHLLIFAFLKGIALIGFGLSPEKLTEGILKGLIFAIIATILTFPIIIFIRRYCRFLVDK